MDDDQQGVNFYQELVAEGVLEEDPEENPKAGPAMGQQVRLEVEPEEYVVTDYEYDESDRESDEGETRSGTYEGKDIKEARNEPHLSKAPSNPRTVLRGDAYHLRSLEEEITNLKRQLFATEARVVRADQRVEVITQEVNELVEHLIRQLND
ncbi:unnamed protein product [Lactuca saligna]|uniref:Uncharacterized protein n=1 Tax=Lactuca saligna TaxID=75948 RepID=A0AA36ENX9_LACSI|nr:unnamed protein product [Lactuca saligna]